MLNIKHLFFVSLFIGILSLPVLQMRFHFLGDGVLGGVEEEAERPTASLVSVFDGVFQREMDEYFSKELGFREELVKADNEISFKLFRQVQRPRVIEASGGTMIVLGKDNWLYEKGYVDENINPRHTPDERLRQIVSQLKRLQDALDARGVPMLLVISPSKATIYPEFIPDGYSAHRIDRPTNYERFIPLLEASKINFLDGRAQFLEWKDTLNWPVFTKGGTHWNYAGACLFVAEMTKKLEELWQRPMIHVTCHPIRMDTTPYGTDSDLANLLNLPSVEEITSIPTPHPTYGRHAAPDAQQPRMLFVGDSFLWTITAIMDRQRMYRDRDFFYYFSSNSEWPEGTFKSINKAHLDWEEDVFSHDMIIIEVNEAAVHKTGFGFMEEALNAIGH